jgi:hypothetical protein
LNKNYFFGGLNLSAKSNFDSRKYDPPSFAKFMRFKKLEIGFQKLRNIGTTTFVARDG